MRPPQARPNGRDEVNGFGEEEAGASAQSAEDAPVTGEHATEDAPEALPTLDDLFAGAKGASCSIDGVCD